jgi:hypothetical protein
MKKQNYTIKSFSEHLFWDVNKDSLSIKNNHKYIINNVLQYGFFADWKIIVSLYSIKKIAQVAIKNKSLDKKTAAFISLVSNTPTTHFLCYTTKPSSPKHWNF